MKNPVRAHELSLAQAAYNYAQQGWPVFPIRERGKEPLIAHGHNNASTNLDKVRSWWRWRPNANIGIAVPKEYVVIDLDSAEAFASLKAEDCDLPSTVTVITTRGKHLWYSLEGRTARNRVRFLTEVDSRTLGAYVLAPPSVHPSGFTYRWEIPLDRSAITECPERLLELINAHTSKGGRSPEDWTRKIATTVPEGQRNSTLAEVAGYYFRYLPARVAQEAAFCWAQVKLDPPLPDQEVQRTIESIASRELRRRQGGV